MHWLEALLEHYHYSRITGSLLQTLPCPTVGRIGHCFWHNSYCHTATLLPSHSLAITEVTTRQPAGPSPTQSPNLGEPSQQHPMTRRNGSTSYVSINHLDTKSSYSVKRLLRGYGQGMVAARQWSLSRDQQEGRLRKLSWSYKGRTGDTCAPLGRTSLIPSPPGYWQNGRGQVTGLKVYFKPSLILEGERLKTGSINKGLCFWVTKLTL